MLLFLTVVALIAGAAAFHFWSKRQSRLTLLATSLSQHQRDIVNAQVPIIRKLPKDLRGALEGKINLFLDQVDFIGCDGLDVTEDMQVSIAAQACLLVVNTDQWYDNLTTILVYPGAFKSKQRRHSGYVVTEQEIIRSGESWNRGPVILSWAHSQRGALNDHDGRNVVFHEFAHQLDDLSGATNGVPVLSNGQSFGEWETAFLNGYKTHVHAVENGKPTVIDPYGAEGHEEFFAVSVEVFFERPHALKSSDPAIYEQLSKLFHLDPAQWHRGQF